MAEEIRLDVVSTAHSQGLQQGARDLRGMRREADEAGKSFHRTSEESFDLGRSIQESRQHVHELTEEFKRTGDPNIIRDLRRAKRELREMTQVAESAGGAAAGGLGGMFDFGGKGIRPMHAAIGGLVAFAAAAAPTIGAMIAGAVTGAAGLGGIAGGIFAASRDPGVERAWQQFASNVSSKFFQMGDSVAEPLVNAAGTIEEAFDNLNLEQGFRTMAPFIDDIATGLSGFAKNFGIGFNMALGNAGPEMEILRKELPELGDALGYMFSKMSEGAGAAEGLEFLMGTLEATIKGAGNVMHFLGDEFRRWMGFMANFSGMMEDIPQPFGLQEKWAAANDAIEDFIADADTGQQTLDGLSKGYLDTSLSAKATADAINHLNDSLLEQNNMMLAQEDARLAYEADLIRIKDAVKEHGTSLDRSTEKGNSNRQMIDAMVGDLGREHDAAIKAAEGNEEKVDRANAAYNRQMDDLKKLLLKLGFEKKAIDEIIGRYNHIPRRIPITFIRTWQDEGKPAGEHSGLRIGETGGRARGGPIWPGEWTVGEEGPERMTVDSSGRGYVWPTSHRGSAGGGRSGGGGTRPVMLNGDPLSQMVFDWIVRELGRRGGTLAAIGIRS